VPAMNTAMFENPIVQNNIEKLKSFGYKFIQPEVGTMAMKGEKDGIGRLPEPTTIVNHILEMNF
jgi:Phosphopantothenoylcysteine synthetase/decarboxylase